MCFSEALPNWLIPFAPPKSLTQISKENVRLFCSSGVICHAKRLSFTSGDVLCRLCHTDLLSADSPLLSTQLLPVQFIPSLLSFHAHLCYFFFYCSAAALTRTQVLVISTWISHSTSAHQILPQFLLGDKRHFLGKESSLLRSLLMLRVPGTLSWLSMPVCEIWLGLRAGFCLETFGKNGSSLRAN